MEKGILIVNKRGTAKVKREDKKEVAAPKIYQYTQFIPESGKSRIACEYEEDDKKQVVKIFINGKELSKNEALIQKREEHKKKKELAEAIAEKEAELEKKYNTHFKNDLFTEKGDSLKRYLPANTTELELKSIYAENYALKLNKFAIFEEKKDKFVAWEKIGKNVKHNTPFWKDDFFEQNKVKQLNLAKSLFGEGNYKPFCQKTDSRLVVGLGGASVYETSMTLHHIYGIPYIPASSIKGVVRSWILVNCFKGLEDQDAEKKAMKDPLFISLFGGDYNSKKYQGSIVFFDAFPTSAPKIVADVMTPHYGDWYGNKKDSHGNTIGPTDTQKPNPIPFLTVGDNTQFQFILGEGKNYIDWRKEYQDPNSMLSSIEKNTTSSLSEIAEAWTKKALSNHGLGAKTAVGYGYFE